MFTFFTITLQFLSATDRTVLIETLGDCKGNTQSSCCYRVIFTTSTKIVWCTCTFPTIISRHYDHFLGQNVYLKSFLVLTISMPCPYRDCAIYLRCVYELRIFQHLSYWGVINNIVEATMPMNPYDDCTVYLWWPHGKGDCDIIQAS